MLPRIIPTEEAEVSRELARAFDRKGIVCQTSAQVREIRQQAAGLEVVAQVGEAESSFLADVVLVAIGRRPNVGGLDLSSAGVEWTDRGIPIDGAMRTNIAHIYAIGDVTGQSLLAHAATHQAMTAVDTILGRPTYPFDPINVPAAIFTVPEVASIGLREAQAQERGVPVVVARFPFAAAGRAAAANETTGFVKILAAEADRKVLGVHIVGGPAGDLIGEASLAIRLGATLDDLASTMHVHPTFSEALLEAAWVGMGTPLHVPPRARRAQPDAREVRSS